MEKMLKSLAKFQSTLPRGERREITLIVHRELNFNPRSREGSDPCDYGQQKRFLISIHAPARGATRLEQSLIPLVIISIHAPARGATDRSCVAGSSQHNFNPRSREGSDLPAQKEN